MNKGDARARLERKDSQTKTMSGEFRETLGKDSFEEIVAILILDL